MKKTVHRTARSLAILFSTVMAGFWLLNTLCAQDLGPTDSEALIHKAQELMERGRDLQAKRAHAESIPPTQQALVIYETVTGPNSIDTAAALDLLGRGYRFAGDYTRAEPLIRRALAIRQKVLGSEDPVTASSLNNLGGLYNATFQFEKAGETYQRVLEIREKVLGPSHPDTATSLNNLAVVYLNNGLYARAETLFLRALAIYEKVDRDSLSVSDTLINLASTYDRSGDSTRSAAILERALALIERTLGPEHPNVGVVLMNLAREQFASGSYDRAFELLRRALTIFERSEGPEHPHVAVAAHTLGIFYRHVGNSGEAEKALLKALDIREKTVGPENLATALALNDLAEVYAEGGSYAKAQTLLARALAIKEKVGAPRDSFSNSLQSLAIVWAHMGEDERAIANFRRALALRESVLGFQHPRTAEALHDFAAYEWARGQSAKALPMLRRVQSIRTKNGQQFLMSGSESRKQAYVQTLADDTYEYVSFALASPSRESVSLGLNGVLQYKGRVLDAMSDSFTRLRESMKSDDRALFQQLTEIAGQISALAYRAEGDAIDYRKQMEPLTARQEKLEAQLSARSTAFRQQMMPITATGVSRKIPSDAALIEWFRYTPFEPRNAIARDKASELHPEPRYAAFIVKRNVDPIVVDVGDAKSIESMIRAYRIAVSDAKRNDQGDPTRLSKALLLPLSAHLKDVNQLFMSPDGALNLVPMAALVDSRGEYLASRFEITYITSGRDLLHMNANSRRHAEGVIVADANFGLPTYLVGPVNMSPSTQRSTEMDRGGLIFRPLVNTALEAQELKRLLRLRNDNVLLRENASETNLRKLHGPQVLHIATHGFFLTDREFSAEIRKNVLPQSSAPHVENPLLRSGIALSGANARSSGANDDGILTALEVAQLDLQGTELVVLSACDTGVGEVMNGEGVYGLRRALVLAGAETQVTSLWKVSDDATRKLMVNYYQRLLQGEGRSAALRHAQLDMLATSEYSHPYYWASFVSGGNWKPLSNWRVTNPTAMN